MNNKFDELTKGLAQSVTRRQAFKELSFGIVGMALVCFGLANNAAASPKACLPLGSHCASDHQCCSGVCINTPGSFFPKHTCQF